MTGAAQEREVARQSGVWETVMAIMAHHDGLADWLGLPQIDATAERVLRVGDPASAGFAEILFDDEWRPQKVVLPNTDYSIREFPLRNKAITWCRDGKGEFIFVGEPLATEEGRKIFTVELSSAGGKLRDYFENDAPEQIRGAAQLAQLVKKINSDRARPPVLTSPGGDGGFAEDPRLT